MLLWAIFSRDRLTLRVRHLLEAEENAYFVSAASLWELAIKIAKGKLPMPGSSTEYLFRQIDEIGVAIVPILPQHILRTETLPHHHRDPFDRMLVAQALAEDMIIPSSDAMLNAYDVPVIWH